MRTVLIAAIAGLILAPSAVLAQAKKPDPPKEKGQTPGLIPQDSPSKSDEITPTTEIGGKTMFGWIKEMNSDDPSRVQAALQNIMLFGPKLTQQAVPILSKYLQKNYFKLDFSVRVNLVGVLGIILHEDNKYVDPKQAKETAFLMTQVLAQEKEMIAKHRTIEALSLIGHNAAVAVPALSDFLTKNIDKECWEIRQGCALALGKIGGNPNPKIGPNLKALQALYTSIGESEKASQVRLASLQGFVWLGAPPDPVTKASVLKKLLGVAQKDPEPSVRIWAVMAYMSIDGHINPKTVGFIAKYVNDKDVTVRVQAVQILYALGTHSKGEVPQLMVALNDPDKTVRAWALMALSRLEKDAKPAVKDLTKIAESKDWPQAFRDLAQQTLEKIQGKIVAANEALPQIWMQLAQAQKGGTAAVKKLAGFLQHTDNIVRLQATQALYLLGPDAKSEVLAIAAALDDEDRLVAVSALLTLARLGKDAAPAEILLKRIVDSKASSAPLKQIAQHTIDRIQGKAVMAPEGDPIAKIWSLMADLKPMSKTNPDIIKQIGDLTADKNVLVRLQAVQALALAGPEARPAVPRLGNALNDPDTLVAVWALMALSRLEKDAAPAVGNLKKVADNNQWPQALRDMAQRTVDTINGTTVGQDKKTPAPKGP